MQLNELSYVFVHNCHTWICILQGEFSQHIKLSMHPCDRKMHCTYIFIQLFHRGAGLTPEHMSLISKYLTYFHRYALLNLHIHVFLCNDRNATTQVVSP